MRKLAFGHMRTAKAQISLRTAIEGQSQSARPRILIGTSLFAKESLHTIECVNGEQMPGWNFAQVQDDLNPHTLRMLEGTFSLDTDPTDVVSRVEIQMRLSQAKKKVLMSYTGKEGPDGPVHWLMQFDHGLGYLLKESINTIDYPDECTGLWS